MRALLVALLGALVFTGSAWAEDELICGKDLDNDTYLDGTGEMLDCINGICPHDAVNCTLGQALCPDGAVLDPDRDVCTLPFPSPCPLGYLYNAVLDVCTANPSCAEGSEYSEATQACVRPPVPACEPPATLNAEGLCEAPTICALGELNTDTMTCEDYATWQCPDTMALIQNQCEAPPVCPAGSDYSTRLNRCEMAVENICPEGYAWNGTACAAAPTCADSAFNAQTGSCETPPDACPSGSSWDPLTDQCATTVSCSGGGSYDPVANICLLPVAVNCPAGTTWNGTLCVSPVICPSGTAFTAALNTCVSTTDPTMTCPTSGYTYNTTTGLCQSTVLCSAGTYNAVTNRCELTPTLSCGPGYTYNATTNLCESAVLCSTGTYNAVTNRCELTSTLSCGPGYTYNAATNLCESAVQCSAGSYNTVTNRCELPATTTCASGFTYVAARGRCEAAPVCASGYTYNPTTNVCTATTPSCPAGYSYNALRLRCEAPPSCASGTYSAAANACAVVVPVSFSGGNMHVQETYHDGAGGGFQGAGAQINYMQCTDWDANDGHCVSIGVGSVVSVVGTTMSGGTPMGSGLYSSMTAAGNQIKFYNCASFEAESSACVGEVLVGTLTASGEVTFSGGVSVYPGRAGMTGITGTGNALNFYFCVEHDAETWACTAWYPVVITASGGTTTYVSASCALGGTLDTIADTCWVAATTATQPALCPAGGLDTTYDVCAAPVTQTCPVGTTLSGSLCVSTATCASGGTLNTTTDVCTQTVTTTCPAGTTLSGSQCVSAATCASGGTLDTSRDVCTQTITTTCPAGTTLSGSQCVSAATCLTGGTLNTTSDVCTQAAVPVCPSGTTLSGSVCTAPPTCPTGTVLSGGQCQSAANLSCPTGYTLSGNQCVKPPDCVVGTFNATNDLCVAGTNPCPTGFTLLPASDVCSSPPICPTGGTYDPTSGFCIAQDTVVCSLSGFLLDSVDTVCWQDADCGIASLDTARDICWIPASPDCGLLSWDETSQLCQGDPTCAQGTFNPQTQMCEWIPQDNCYEWTLNQGTHLCESPPQCPTVPNYSLAYSVEFDEETGLCLMDAQHECLPGYVPVEPATCEKPMSCPEGEYDPVANVCPTSYICPLGSQYSCADMGSGTTQCSPYTCLDLSTDNTPDETADTSTYVDDGEMIQTGECLGLWKIFSGKGTECLTPGLSTTFFNCCDDDESSFLIFQEYCPEESFEAVSARASGRTHYIGTYCKRRIPFIGCVQRAKMYCAFNSKIGRIIQEGCRPQLYDFAPTGAWGTAKHPNCIGFSPEQFQSCDFGKIDFSEVAADFAPNLNLIVPSLQGALNAVP